MLASYRKKGPGALLNQLGVQIKQVLQYQLEQVRGRVDFGEQLGVTSTAVGRCTAGDADLAQVLDGEVQVDLVEVLGVVARCSRVAGRGDVGADAAQGALHVALTKTARGEDGAERTAKAANSLQVTLNGSEEPEMPIVGVALVGGVEFDVVRF